MAKDQSRTRSRRCVNLWKRPLKKLLVKRLSSFHQGWVIGNFTPSLLRTKAFEVGIKRHYRGEYWPNHYQNEAWEYTIMLQGMLRINDQVFTKGECFAVPPGYPTKPYFLTDCLVVVIKTPSDPTDKVLLEC